MDPNSSKIERTVAFYDKNADAFRDRTLSIDMSHLHSEFLGSLAPAAHILDLGCGVGRDTKAFLDAGYVVTAIDASREMVRMTSELTGQRAQQMRFGEIQFESAFDGVWACASLLHVPRRDLSGILTRIARSLRDNGILHMCVKYGDREEFRTGRWFCDYTVRSLDPIVSQVGGLRPVRYWVNADPRKPDTSWLHAMVRRA